MTQTYSIPQKYFFRLHHIRPRFKNNVEEVLHFMATEIAGLDAATKELFDQKLNRLIRLFPGNAAREEKTISNWRTEISSLFGFVISDSANETERASEIAQKLGTTRDVVEFFKNFLYDFQYPGGHLKSQEIKKLIDADIKFIPAPYILAVIKELESKSAKGGITRAEATHCIFNDLRVTRDNISPADAAKTIIENRKKAMRYDWEGDVIRYAGDILDYMVLANLLQKYGEFYKINETELSVHAFLRKRESYAGYDKFYGKTFSPADLKLATEGWFLYIEKAGKTERFKTDVLAYLQSIDSTKKEYAELEASQDYASFAESIGVRGTTSTKAIGDRGTSLVHGHECMRLKIGGRKDLIHKVVVIPDKYAVGFDIQSFEVDEKLRLIEVKSTISSGEINFSTFHMSENEWNAAGNYGSKYCVYRLMISKQGVKLFVLRDPVGLYKKGLISIVVHTGVHIKFQKSAGSFEGLLTWKS
jgi:hypothetical protein